MARVFIEGFESGAIAGWDVAYNANISGSYKYTGNYGLQFGSGGYLHKYVASQSSYYAALKRWYNGGYQRGLVGFYEGTTLHAGIELGYSAGNYYTIAYRGGTLVDTDYTYFPYNTWLLIEVYALINDSTGAIIVKINGIETVNFSGDTRNGGTSGVIDGIRFGRTATPNDVNGPYWDDLVIDDSEWIGNTAILGLSPSGAGSNTNWTPSAGSNYQTVDEVPASDADYNAVNSVDQIDTFAMGDLPFSPESIKAVQVSVRAQKEGASTPQNIAPTVKSGSTTDSGADQALETSFRAHSKIWPTDPDTASAWTESGVNALEAGYKSRT